MRKSDWEPEVELVPRHNDLYWPGGSGFLLHGAWTKAKKSAINLGDIKPSSTSV